MSGISACATIAMDSFEGWKQKEKVIFVIGATGTGKSKLSIDLATHFHAEIVNSDKMQVYKGLDIVTNKVTEEEQRGIPHHLLGEVEPEAEFTAFDFCHLALLAVESILERNRLPIIVGGSNSYIEALVEGEDQIHEFRSKYECCFLWMDVSLNVLYSFIERRVDQMVKAGLVDEVRKLFEPNADYSRGIKRAIGVPEMDAYLRAEESCDEETRKLLLGVAIDEIKGNTCKLANCQVKKIQRLQSLSGWNVHRIDATDVFLKSGKEADEAWQKLVLEPSTVIVEQFLHNRIDTTATTTTTTAFSTSTTSVAGLHHLHHCSHHACAVAEASTWN